MQEPITIAMCVYNAEEYLQETLDSLMQQSYENIRFLFIEDGSTDKSINVIENFCKNNEYCKVVKLEKNSGTARARNEALKNADTELMMFFDSDDVAKPELVETLYNKLKKTKKCIAVSCFAQYISDTGKKLRGGMFMGTDSPEEFLERAESGKLTFMVPATLFYKQYALKAGGYRIEGFPKGDIRYEDLSEDLDLWSRMSDFVFDGKNMIVEKKVLYYYRKRLNSLSAPKEKQYAMTLKIKYIKENLRRRRQGKEEITFIDFMNGLSTKKKRKIKRDFYAEYYFRNAAFGFVEKKYFMIVPWLILSFVLKPSYLLQKVTANYKK